MTAYERDRRELQLLPRRPADGHKGLFGHALLVGGSLGMPGAVSLAGMSCLRGGAGLVTLAVASAVQPIVAGFNPCFMTVPLPASDEGLIAAGARPLLESWLDKATVIGCGPGLGRSAELDELVVWLYTTAKQPAVFDADALNALAQNQPALASPGGPRILTPHPGEFQRLIGQRDRYSVERREELAASFAARERCVLVLKGQGTIVSDGQRVYVNDTGNPGMATGGTGDVLTGLLTALVAQHLPPYEAARLAVHLHGLAGDLAAERLGQVSLTAADLIDSLPQCFKQVGFAKHSKG